MEGRHNEQGADTVDERGEIMIIPEENPKKPRIYRDNRAEYEAAGDPSGKPFGIVNENRDAYPQPFVNPYNTNLQLPKTPITTTGAYDGIESRYDSKDLRRIKSAGRINVGGTDMDILIPNIDAEGQPDFKPQFKGGDVPDEQFDLMELEKGIEVEKEHTDDVELAKQIAKGHLLEDKLYYQKLERMEATSKNRGDSVQDADKPRKMVMGGALQDMGSRVVMQDELHSLIKKFDDKNYSDKEMLDSINREAVANPDLPDKFEIKKAIHEYRYGQKDIKQDSSKSVLQGGPGSGIEGHKTYHPEDSSRNKQGRNDDKETSSQSFDYTKPLPQEIPQEIEDRLQNAYRVPRPNGSLFLGLKISAEYNRGRQIVTVSEPDTGKVLRTIDTGRGLDDALESGRQWATNDAFNARQRKYPPKKYQAGYRIANTVYGPGLE